MINHILSINCPQCGSPHEWNTTTNPDPRCYRCKYESVQHVVPRRAVEGDIGNWAECQSMKGHADLALKRAREIFSVWRAGHPGEWNKIHLTFDELALILLQTLNDPRNKQELENDQQVQL